MRKKELALQVIERLKKEYPDTGCSLDYDDAWIGDLTKFADLEVQYNHEEE